MEKTETKGVFETLFKVNVNDHTEKKSNGSTELTYLSWPFAWAEVVKRYPDASYTIYKNENGMPYLEDADFGIMCQTTVTINGQTHEMWLPVMDSSNKAMRRTAYQYQARKYDPKTRDYVVKNITCPAVTMFDINKTIMRCLVKNIAMFGLGLYIYAGEDLPEAVEDEKKEDKKERNEQGVNIVDKIEPKTTAAKMEKKAAKAAKQMEIEAPATPEEAMQPITNSDDEARTAALQLTQAMEELAETKTAAEVAKVWDKYPLLKPNAAFKNAVANLGKKFKEQETQAKENKQ